MKLNYYRPRKTINNKFVQPNTDLDNEYVAGKYLIVASNSMAMSQ